jgi:flagellar basal-body rod protein FlgB
MGMFIDRLISQESTPLLEQVVRFTAARHRLIAQNIANVDTPNYLQKDLSIKRFQKLMSERVEQRRRGSMLSYDDALTRVEEPVRDILFHDGNNRSMEQLASDLAKNAMMHNMAIEMLRKQFQQMDMALKERVV